MLRLPESEKASLELKLDISDRQDSFSQMNQPILINSKDIFENADMVDKPNHLIGDASRFDVLTLDVETPKLLPPKHRHTITIHQRYLRSNQIPYWPEMTWACPNFYLKNLGFATPTWKEDSPQRPWSCEWESCASDRKSDEAVNMKRSCMFMQCFFYFSHISLNVWWIFTWHRTHIFFLSGAFDGWTPMFLWPFRCTWEMFRTQCCLRSLAFLSVPSHSSLPHSHRKALV